MHRWRRIQLKIGKRPRINSKWVSKCYFWENLRKTMGNTVQPRTCFRINSLQISVNKNKIKRIAHFLVKSRSGWIRVKSGVFFSKFSYLNNRPYIRIYNIYRYKSNRRMCKRSYVLIMKKKRNYKLLAEDIVGVYAHSIKKRPSLPKFEASTDCENLESQLQSNVNLLTLWYLFFHFFTNFNVSYSIFGISSLDANGRFMPQRAVLLKLWLRASVIGV